MTHPFLGWTIATMAGLTAAVGLFHESAGDDQTRRAIRRVINLFFSAVYGAAAYYLITGA